MKQGFICLIFLSVLLPCRIFGQEPVNPLYRAEDQAMLEAYRSKAEAHVRNNLNRFGLESLQRYDVILDSLYKKELDDTVLTIEKNFSLKSSDIRRNIREEQKNMRSLTATKTALGARYENLLDKALIAFGIWLLLVLFMLQYKKRTLRQAQQKLDVAVAQLNALKLKSEEGKKLFNTLHNVREVLNKLCSHLNSFYLNLQSIHDHLPAGHPQGEQVLGVVRKGSGLLQSASKEEQLCETLLRQEKEPDLTTQLVNINQLCDFHLEIAQRGFLAQHPDFNCTITRDFEKNLPPVKLVPGAGGSLLLNILHNALLSVKERMDSGTKGYQAKVAMSTRVLPRFLQVRIKDNGNGMSDEVLSKIKEEFYSTRPLEQGAGLGLSASNQLFSESVKGELKIESEPGNGTDVYIKFDR